MITGPVMTDLSGTTLTDDDKRTLESSALGGVILFSRNLETPTQVERLLAAVRERRPEILIAIDQEGGRVQRMKTGLTRLPAMDTLGRCYDREPEQALAASESIGYIMASEIRALGFDLSFAPVLDLNRGVSAVIGDRAFHSESKVVGRLANAYIHGMHRAGMRACGKHYPGHGAVVEDSHTAVAKDLRNFEAILETDLAPFVELFPELSAIMVAHVIFPNVDDRPAGYSVHWLKTLLRDRFQYGGAVFSDDLSMIGAGSDIDAVSKAQKALSAGCDMVLVCNQPEDRASVLAALSGYVMRSESQNRLTALKPEGRALDLDALQRSTPWQRAKQHLAMLAPRAKDPHLV